MGQYFVMLLEFCGSSDVSFDISIDLIRRINSPLNSGAVKNLLHEFKVFPGFKSISKLDSVPLSGRNLSCSWLLQKISLFMAKGCSIDKSESLTGNEKKI